MSHHFIRWMLLIACLCACSQHAHAAALAIDGNLNPRIMPLGDSITAGYSLSVGGYRSKLRDQLVGAGYSFTYVGSQDSYNPSGMTGLNHEGHSGWTTPQLTAIVNGSFSSNSTSATTIISTSNPDVILLMIGTNDMLGGGATLNADYSDLLTAIFVKNTSIRVIVYPMIYCSVFSDVQADNVTYGGRDIQFINGVNVVASRSQSSLVHTVTAFQRAGRRITFFDGMTSVVTAVNCHDTAVLVDGVHPTAPTYAAMGDAVLRSLQDVTPGAVPSNIAPTRPSGMLATPNGNGFDVSWTVNSLNETGFAIEATTDPLFVANIVSFPVAAASNSATITGLQANSTYYLRVHAANGAGSSPSTFPIKSDSGSGSSSGTVATPTLSPAPGTYSSAQSVTLACSTAGATIHYTTDGSTPTASSAVYAGAIAVTSTTAIQAIATASGMTNSAVASGTYTIAIISPPPATVATPTFTPAPGTYSSAQSVTIACSTAGATIHYTTDGSTPTASSAVYAGAISVTTTTTVKAMAAAPGMTDSSVASSSYTIAGGTIVSPPSNVVATGETSTQINVTWTNPGSATAVEVQYDTNSAFSSPLSLVLDGAADYAQLSHLTPATTYYVRVCCRNGSPSSAWVTGQAPTLVLTDVILVGDSITYSWGYTKNGTTIVSRAIPGDMSTNANDRFFSDVIIARPRLVTILIGTNDIANGVQLATVENNIAAMVQLAKSHGIGVILGTVLPAGNTSARPDATIQSLNTWIVSYAGSQGLFVADYNTAFSPYDSTDFVDGLHPNAQGYGIMSAVMNAVLPTALSAQGPGFGSAPTDPLAYVAGGNLLNGNVFGDGSANPAFAWDANSSTMFESGSANGSNGYTGIDLGGSFQLTGYRFLARQDSLYGRSFGGRLQGSNTSSTTGYSDITIITLMPFPNRTVAYGIAGPTTYRWIRYFSPTGGLCDVSDVSLYGTSSASSAVATPTFTPAPGTYGSAQTVTIACSTAGATMHYTTDGSTPTASSTVYAGAITVTSTTTIQAIATASGMTNSAVASGTYTIAIVPPPPTTVATPTFTPAPGTYSSAQSVTIACSTSGASIHYTTDGSTPTASSVIYAGAITVGSTTTIQAIATGSGMTTSNVASATYTITSVPPPATVATPTFTPPPGSYSTAQSVTIACSTAGANIRYTTDGSTPNGLSTIYMGPIAVSATTTIKAIGVATGMTTSSVASATYTITGVPPPPATVATPTFTPPSGTYSSAQSVTITCSTAGATIHYTTDGATPTASSTVYAGAIAVASTTTIQAIATATGMTNSAVASATYTITSVPPPASVATPTFTPAPGTYSSAQSVTIGCSTAGATIHYTTDGSIPSASSTVYAGTITVSSTTTLQAIATATGMTNSAVASATYTITREDASASNHPFAESMDNSSTGCGSGSLVGLIFMTAVMGGLRCVQRRCMSA